MTVRPSRKLAVILHADVVGSTTLVQTDETLAHERIQDGFRRFSKTIEAYGGTAHELRGDALVAQFGRASDAVMAAIAFQADNTQFIATLEDDIRPWLRVGIAVGEVVIADNTVTGSGVVLAQRLEQLADPGGVCIQGAAHEIVPKRLPFDYQSQGEQTLKGFEEPVRAYAVTLKAGEVVPAPESVDRPVVATLELPDKPSIAVLPFTNMSGDPEQEYFSDGITDDITTELSRFRELFVIARNSAFTYKGKAVKVQEVASDLGVRYVVEGSVRAAGNRIRITVQLVDADTGHHIWAERYDRELTDIFALQDEVTQSVVATLAGQLRAKAEDRAARKPVENLDAYDQVLRGDRMISEMTKEGTRRARMAYEKAVELDPTFSRAHVGLSTCHMNDWMNRWVESVERSHSLAVECAAKAVALDNTDSVAQRRLGILLVNLTEFEEAKIHIQRGLDLNPNDANGFVAMGIFLIQAGKPDEAIDHIIRGMRLNPYYPARYPWKLGVAYYTAKRYSEAVTPLKEAINLNPKFMMPHRALAATYAQLGRVDEARAMVEQILAEEPHASLKQENWGNYKYPEDLEHWLDGMRKSGLPE